MNENPLISKEFLESLFDYKDGVLFWKKRTSIAIQIGDVAGGHHGGGYFKVRVNGKKRFVHRVVFLMHHGFLPEFIDHIDGDPSNNKIENLREATMSQNCMNKKLQSNNTTGVRGVHFDKKTGKFVAAITVKRKRTRLGSFDDLESAKHCYLEKIQSFHGEFTRSQP